MPAFIDLTGYKIGKWTVLRYDPLGVSLRNRGAYFVCRCECGQERSVRGQYLRGESPQSTGCRQCANRISAKGNQRAKQNPERIAEVLALRANDRSVVEIAAVTGISRQRVYQIIKTTRGFEPHGSASLERIQAGGLLLPYATNAYCCLVDLTTKIRASLEEKSKHDLGGEG